MNKGIRFLVFDSVTGEIISRGTVTNPIQRSHYSSRLEVGIDDFTSKEYDLAPELWWNVNVSTRKLIDISDTELRKRHGLKLTDPLPTKPTKAERGR